MLLFFYSCRPYKNSQTGDEVGNKRIHTLVHDRFLKLANYKIKPKGIPRSLEQDLSQINTSSSTTWTSGFFAGNLWYIYQLTGDAQYKAKAKRWTKIIEKEKNNDTDHDIGFKIACSYGNGHKITNNPKYAAVIIKSANTLLTRYNDTVKAIKSWNSKIGVWEYPVIIDNMMNLELLFEATSLTKDSVYYKVAINHANTTLKNHFRSNHSTFHVVDYLSDGTIKTKKTHQGYSDNSAWARGQAWAVYGFTMAYRYSRNIKYLIQAEETAQFYLSHENLPSDGVPFWDFNDPNIPDAPKDVSASTIMASAFFELYEYTKKDIYINYASKVLNNVVKPDYLLDRSNDAPFILSRSTGNYNKKSEIDVPIVYADYYFLEALVRQRKYRK